MRRRAVVLVIVALSAVAAPAVFVGPCGPVIPREPPPVRPETKRGDRTASPRPRPGSDQLARAVDEPTNEGRPAPTPQLPISSFEIVFQGPVDLPLHVLHGRVEDPDGKPVADAEVELFSTWLPDVAQHWNLSPDGRFAYARDATRSRADGAFTLRWYDGGVRSLHVRQGGHASWIRCEIVAGVDVEIVSAPTGVHVGGRVTREDGTPARGTKVELLASDSSWRPYLLALSMWTAETTTDDVGRFAVDDAPIGLLLAWVDSEDATPDPADLKRVVDVPRGGTDAIALTVRPGFVLTGRVTDGASGRPLAGVKVLSRQHAQTGPDGRYRIDHVPGAPRRFSKVAALADGYVDSLKVVRCPDDPKSEAVLDFALDRPASVRLRCVDSAGEPLDHVVVAVIPVGESNLADDGTVVEPYTHVDYADAYGRVRLLGLPPSPADRDIVLRFWVGGVPALDRKYPPLSAGESREIGDVVLGPTLTLRGTVLDSDGNPAADVTVTAAPADPAHVALAAVVSAAGGRHAKTDASGAFALRGLAPGMWDVLAARDCMGVTRDEARDLLQPGAVALGVDPKSGDLTLRLPRVAKLRGRVVDAKGAAVAGAEVTELPTSRLDLPIRWSTSTAADGRFDLADVAAESTVGVRVVALGHVEQSFEVLASGDQVELRLR